MQRGCVGLLWTTAGISSVGARMFRALAFFNDTGARFNPHAATEAWRRMLNWFDGAGPGRD